MIVWRHRGVSIFCHNTYVAQVLDMVLENGKPVIESALYFDRYCLNPIAATNL
jgi:hypothetical protein